MMNEINGIRQQHGGLHNLIWSAPSQILAGTLTQKCDAKPQQGETVSPGIDEPPTWENTVASVRTLGLSDVDAFKAGYAVVTGEIYTSFACAWNALPCADRLYYLHCIFGTWPVDRDGESTDLVEAEPKSTSLLRRQGTKKPSGTPFARLCEEHINWARDQAGLPIIPYDPIMADFASYRATKCDAVATTDSAVEVIGGYKFSFGIGATPDQDTTLWVLDRWVNDLNNPVRKRIVHPRATSFGCAWNKEVCPGGMWYLHCAMKIPLSDMSSSLSDSGPGAQDAQELQRSEVEQTQGILDFLADIEALQMSKRQDTPGALNISSHTILVGLVLDMLPGLNQLRKDAGVDPVRFDYRRLGLVTNALQRGATCSDFTDLADNQVLLNYQWANLVLGENPDLSTVDVDVPRLWNETRNDDDNTTTYVKLTQPQWDLVGCWWSKNCTAANNYILYCELGTENSTQPVKAAELTPRQTVPHVGPHLVTETVIVRTSLVLAVTTATVRPLPASSTSATPAPATTMRPFPDLATEERMVAGMSSIREMAHLQAPKMYNSTGLAKESLADANQCNGSVNKARWRQITYFTNNASFDWARESLNALGSWDDRVPQGSPGNLAYQIIIHPDTESVGCAWSKKCGDDRWLYCTFYPAILTA
jgi:hypothetical protein